MSDLIRHPEKKLLESVWIPTVAHGRQIKVLYSTDIMVRE
jgi:hypothetical protein